MPPNVLFIFADQQRWDSIGAYGQRLPVTPNLDRLAAEGVRFEHAFACQPVCGPARACLQSGLFATQTGCHSNNIALPQGAGLLAAGFRGAGYELGYVGKWHLGSNGGEFHHAAIPLHRRGGFDGYWYAADLPEYVSSGYAGKLFDQTGGEILFEGYRADFYTDLALRFLDSCSRSRPFFLFLSYVEPHPQPYHAAYRGPVPRTREGIVNEYLRYDCPEGWESRFAQADVPGDLQDTPGDWNQHGTYARYLASCAAVDGNVGRLMRRLEEIGVAEDTLIVYTADHACHFRTRTTANDGKCTCHDNSVRIPMIARGPGFQGGRCVGELASLIDLPPTLLTAAGAAVPTAMRGRPLQPLAAGDASGWPDSVYIQITGAGQGRAIRTKRWTYAIAPPPDAPARQGIYDRYIESHLYDLHADPYQQANLVAKPSLAACRRQLRARLVEWMEHAGEPTPAIEEQAV